MSNPVYPFQSYDGTCSQTTIDNMYNLVSCELAERVRQIKLIHLIQKTLSDLTYDAHYAMIVSIKLFLKNEQDNRLITNINDLESITTFFNQYGSEHFWANFYSKHASNPMIQKILDFIQ